jgi:hypothetical protein
MLRAVQSALFAALLVALTSHGAHAQEERIDGTYPSSFEKVIDNCDGKGMDLKSESVVLKQTGRKLAVTIASLPTLEGRLGRGGKLRAKLKRGATRQAGLQARYGLKGSVSRRELQAVLIIEYYQGKKPICTQSFNLEGSRK